LLQTITTARLFIQGYCGETSTSPLYYAT